MSYTNNSKKNKAQFLIEEEKTLKKKNEKYITPSDLTSISSTMQTSAIEAINENGKLTLDLIKCSSVFDDKGKFAPTAAKASSPKTLPTIMLSTILYICWKTFPSSIGSAKFRILFPSLPVVKSFN